METPPERKNYRTVLVAELAKRQVRNSGYSLRSFAKHLGLSVSCLSDVINGKRDLSRPSADKVIARLGLNPDQETQFLTSLYGIGTNRNSSYQNLDVDGFKLISDWYHLAILSLAEMPGNKADPNWIANRLNISVKEASDAFDRLLRLQMIQTTRTGFAPATSPFYTGSDAPNTAIQKFHHQNLEKAAGSLADDPVEERDFSAITMAANPDQLPAARTLIKKFREELCALLETGTKKRVYTLSIQLFPVSKSTDKE